MDGAGAIVSTRSPCYIAFSDVELTDDASIGGTVRSDFRHSTAYGSVRGTTRNTLTGPGKCLTVRNSAMLTLVGTTVDLGSILVPEGYELRIEGVSSYSLPGGIRLAGGRLSFYGAEATHGTAPLMAESGDSTISCSSGTPTFRIRNSPADTENLKVVGAKGAETVRLRQSGTYTGADIWCHSLGMGDVANTSLDIVFRDSTIDVNNFMVGWGLGTATALASANISIAEGTTVTTPKVAIGDDGTSISNNVKTVLSVDGGTLNLTNNDFFVAYNGPNAEFVVNSGTANVDKAVIKLRANNQSLGGYNKACFVQNGGTFNYGGPGFTARYEDNTEDGQIVFRGGEFNASTNWAIPNWISTYFKDGAEGGWTLNQADGTTNTWNTALVGSGDVTLNGSATLVGNKEVQGVISGKWTIGDGFTAGLEGASSLLGGLAVGEGATATIDIATDRSAVFTARDFSAEPTEATCITSRFNKQFGGTTRGTITHDESLLFTHYDQATRPFGDMNYTATYAVGQFYVEEGAAGEWTFKGKCDDWVLLWIDGESVMASSGRCAEANGTKTLSAGWHSFRHIATDNGGAFGADNGNAYQTIGYKDGSGTMANFARFNVENLKMRPAADMGDPNNPNTLRWSHYKGTSSTVTASTFKNQDFAWDFCCITNNLQYLQWYGSSDTTWFNTYTVNRYEGWFFVTAENAGKEWTFRSNYDDRCALWIDGVDSGLDGNNGSTLTYKVTLSAGWHRFRIQTADFTGNAGPWNGNGLAVSYQIDDGSETFFGTDTLAMTVCPDGYVQGEVALASNARLANNVATGAAEVYGTVKATGTGATMSGPFKFRGAKLAYANVASNARDLTQLLAFENASDDMFAELGGISVDFSAEPTVGTITVAPVYGLDLTDLAENVPVAVTVNGQPYNKKFRATIKDGSIAIVFRSASVLFLR